jgi:hypothetical protein
VDKPPTIGSIPPHSLFPPLRPSGIGRNIFRGPSLWQIDLALSKTFAFAERLRLQFRAETFNILNRAQYGNPNANLSTLGNFGTITTLANPRATGSGTSRQIQLALRLSF